MAIVPQPEQWVYWVILENWKHPGEPSRERVYFNWRVRPSEFIHEGVGYVQSRKEGHVWIYRSV